MIVRTPVRLTVAGRTDAGYRVYSGTDVRTIRFFIDKEMEADNGLPADVKAEAARKAGWKQIRQALKDALPQEMKREDGSVVNVPRDKPGLFVFNTCTMFVELFPIAPRDEKDPDDIDTDSEDHIADEVRYKVLSTNIGVRGGRTTGM